MRRLPQISLSSAPFIASLLVIVSLGIFIGIFWAFNEYEAYQKSIANIRQNYQESYQSRGEEELSKIIDFIEYWKSQLDTRIEEEVREKVQSAYSIAAHLCSLYKDEKDTEELRQMVVELLRPIRWDSGLGYYFTGAVDTGAIDLFADKPEYEGMNMYSIEDMAMREVFAQMIEIAIAKGAGTLKYNWFKPEVDGKEYPKISYVKFFEPFNWLIGAGIYVDEMEERIQEDILELVKQISFGQAGEVLVFRLDGIIISARDQRLNGRSVIDLADVEMMPYGQEMLQIALSAQGGGYLEYTAGENVDGVPARRAGFVKSYPGWGWGIATSLSMEDMEDAIALETQTYRSIAFKNIFLFLFLFSVAVSLLLLLSYFYSMKIKHGIELFTDFFRKAAYSTEGIEEKHFLFKEFQVLGEYANRMIEDRLAKDLLLKRDELRLDTLLRLGMFEEHGIQGVFDFMLVRMAEITGSGAGYFATVKNNLPELKSQVIAKDGVWHSLPAQRRGVAADQQMVKVFASRQMQMRRNVEDCADATFFPINEVIRQRIEVPVFENDEIVAVLGLCNSVGPYDENDYRQITLILEGMWLHINRLANRKEMRRLRQLLGNVTDSMPSMLIGLDHQLRIMQWNKVAASRTGIEAEKAVGSLLFDILPRLARYENDTLYALASGRELEITRVPYLSGGETRFESITIFPLILEGENGVALRIDETTKSVQMEDAMIQSEKMHSLGEVAAGIAHEINNPLASVVHNIQVVENRLLSQLPKNHSVADEVGIPFAAVGMYLEKRGVRIMLEAIGRDSRRSAQLVHNMLSFSRKSESVFKKSDLRKLLDAALVLGLADYDLRKNHNFREICVEKEYDTVLSDVSCEATNIQQVFLNVIRNAAHAIAANRKNIEVPTLILRAVQDQEMVRVEIEDNGVGIDPVTSRRIFEPFFTTKGVGKGTGLGLSISYYIVNDQHHGSLEVRSQPGLGSCFIVRLPISRKDSV